jgi:hypothetical protein
MNRTVWDVKVELKKMMITPRIGSEDFPGQHDLQVTQDGVPLAAFIAASPSESNSQSRSHCLMQMPSDPPLDFKDVKARYGLYAFSCASDLNEAIGRVCASHFRTADAGSLIAGDALSTRQKDSIRRLRKNILSTRSHWDERDDEQGSGFNVVSETTDASGASRWTAPPITLELSQSTIETLAPVWRGRKVFVALCQDLRVTDAWFGGCGAGAGE